MSGVVSLGGIFTSSQYSSTREQSFLQLRGVGFIDGSTASETGNLQVSDFTNKTIGFSGDWSRVDEIKLEPGNKDGDYFGREVAINETGSTLIVSQRITELDSGIVYVYTRSGDLWTLQSTLEVPVGIVPYSYTSSFSPYTTITQIRYGISVHISYSGDTILVGVPYESTNSVRGGALCIFSRSNSRGNYSLDSILRQPSPYTAYAEFGQSCAISGDGNTVIIGEGNGNVVRVYINAGAGWSYQAALLGASNTHFGQDVSSVSISENGNTVLIGAPYTTIGGFARCGEARVYVRSGTSWFGPTVLRHGDPENDDRMGRAVSLSGDGNTAICGAWYEDGTGSQSNVSGSQYTSGSAYIFVRSGTSTWNQQAKIQHSDSGYAHYFGERVSINHDGTIVICGAIGVDYPYPDAGAAYIFTRSGSTWTERSKIQAQDIGHADHFGRSLAMSGDGSMVLIGSQWSSVQGSYNNFGGAYLYMGGGSYGVGRLTGGYGNKGTLLKRDWTKYDISRFYSGNIRGGDYFGWDSAISKHGERLLVTARYKDDRKGAAYIFQKTSENTWAQQADLHRDTPDVSTSASPTQDQMAYSFGYLQYGWSCDISSDGNMAAVGATWHSKNGLVRTGAVAVWRQFNFNWYHMQLLQEPTPTQNRYFGTLVAFSEFGDMIVVGGGFSANRVWVFQLTGNDSQGYVWSLYQQINGPAGVADAFGTGIGISNDANTIVVSAPYTDYVSNGVALEKSGVAYVYERSSSTGSYSLTVNLRDLTTDAAAYDLFGGDDYYPTRSVAISGDGNTIAIGAVYKDTTETPSAAYYVYSGPGQVYIFVRTGGVWSEQAKFKPNNITENHRFGEHVSLSENGDRLIVGCPSAFASGGWPNAQYTVPGSAHIFTRSGTTWTETQLITAPGSVENGSHFGRSVSMSGSGEYASVGANKLKIEVPASEYGPGQLLARDKSGAAFIISALGPAI